MSVRFPVRPGLLAVLVITAGCLGFGGPSFQPLPDRPDAITADSAGSYAWDYERTLVQNRLIERFPDIQEVTFDRQRLRTNASGDGYWVHIEYTLRYRTSENPTVRNRTVNYFVNATATRRAATDGFVRPGPDARNGTLVERDDPAEDGRRTVRVQTVTNTTSG